MAFSATASDFFKKTKPRTAGGFASTAHNFFGEEEKKGFAATVQPVLEDKRADDVFSRLSEIRHPKQISDPQDPNFYLRRKPEGIKEDFEQPQLKPLTSETSKFLSDVDVKIQRAKEETIDAGKSVSGAKNLLWLNLKGMIPTLARMIGTSRIAHADDEHPFAKFEKKQAERFGYEYEAKKTVGEKTGISKIIEDIDKDLSQSLKKWGEESVAEIQKESQKVAQAIPNKTVAAITSGVGSIVEYLAVSSIATPAGGLAFLTLAESQNTYNEAIDAGKSSDEALAIFAVSAAGTAALEKIGFSHLLKSNAGKKFFVNLLSKSVFEGGQEMTQQVWQNSVSKFGYDKSKKIFDGLWESFIGGMAGGGFATTGFTLKERWDLKREIKRKTGENDEGAEKLLREIESAFETQRKLFTEGQPIGEQRTAGLRGLEKPQNFFAERNLPEGAISAALGTIPRPPALLGEEAARGKITSQKPFAKQPELSRGRQKQTGDISQAAQARSEDVFIDALTEKIITKPTIEKRAVVIDADALKKIINPKDPNAAHKEGSKMANKLYTKALNLDETGKVQITGGGTGSGKTEVILDQIKGEPSVIFDTTLGKWDNAVRRIEEALKAGKDVKVHPIYIPIEDAWLFKNTRTERIVEDEIFLNLHAGFRENIPKLMEKFPQVEFDFYRNAKGMKGEKIPFKNRELKLAFAKQEVYTLIELKQKLDDFKSKHPESAASSSSFAEREKGRDKGDTDRQLEVSRGDRERAAERPDSSFLTEKEAGDLKAAKTSLKQLQKEISGIKTGLGAFGIGKTNLGVLAEMAVAGDPSAIDLQKRTEQAQAKVNELERKAAEGRQAEMAKEREREEKLELARAAPKVEKFYESSYWVAAKERGELEKPMTVSQKKIVLTRINISDKGKYDAKFDATELLALEESGDATIRLVEIPAGERVAATFALEGNKEKSYKPFIYPLVQQSLKAGKTVYVDVNSGGATVVKMLPDMMNSGMDEAHLNFFDTEKFIIESFLQRHGADGVISRLTKVDTQHRRELLQNLAKSRHKNVREIVGAYLKGNPAGSFDKDFVDWTKETTINGEKIPPPIQGSKFYRAWRDAMQIAHQKISPQVQATNIDSAVKIMYAEKISVRGNQGFIGTNGLHARPKTVENLTKNLELDAEAYSTVRNRGGKVTLHSADGKKFVANMVKTLGEKIGKSVFYTDPPYIRTTETYIAKQASPQEVAALRDYTSPAGLESVYQPALKAVEEHGTDLIMTNDINAGYLKMLLKYPFNSTVEVYRENTTPTSLSHTLSDNSNLSLYEVNEKYMDIEGYEPESAVAKEAIRKRAVSVKKMIRRMTRQEKPSSYYEDEHGLLVEYTTRELRAWYRNIEQQQTKATVEKKTEIKNLAKERGISDATLWNIIRAVGAREFKNASVEQVQKIERVLKKMKAGDKLLTDKQLAGLKSFLGEDSPFLSEEGLGLITQREVREKLGEQEILNGGLMRWIPQSFLPTIESKFESPVIRKIADKADQLLRDGEKVHKTRMEKFADLLDAANKSFKRPAKERLLGINPRIFRALDVNAKVELTPAEQKLAEFMRSELKTAADDMKLERRRIKYVPHIEKQLMESIITDGLLNAVSRISKDRAGLPTDILLALDNIFSTEKYFKYAQQRKGGIKPTMNIGKIFDQYFQLVEKKKALDQVLPEVNMANKLLLEGNTAKWLQDFAKNLSGRKLDNKIRYGKGGWAYKGLESLVNLGYMLKLSFRTLSATKNLVGGEVNSAIWQGFGNYSKGKARLISHPIRAYKMIDESGITDGSFADYAKMKPTGVVSRTRQVFDIAAWGQQQGVEFQIRGSFYLGELTQKEFDTGKVSPERFREIMNNIAQTQGVFTAVDAPLAAQTTFGRVALQFLRWKLTNLMMIRRITKNLHSEYKAGRPFSKESVKNWNRLIFAVSTFLLAFYLEKELYKAGWKKTSQVAKASGDFLGSIIDFVSLEDLKNMLPDMPATSTAKEIIFSWQEVLSMTGLIEEPRKLKFSGGIENTYTAPWQQLKDFGLISNEKQDENYLKARQEIYKEEIKKLVEKGKLDLSQAETDEAIARDVLTEEQVKRMHQDVIKEEYDIESIDFTRYETAEDYKKVMAIPEKERDRLIETLSPKTLDALEKWEFAEENPDATAYEFGVFLAGQKEESRDELFTLLESLNMSEEDKAKVAKEKKTEIEVKKATVPQCYTHAKRVAMLAGADYEEIKDKPEGWKCGMKAGKISEEQGFGEIDFDDLDFGEIELDFDDLDFL